MASPHQLVRFKSGKITFEILTKPGTCLKFRQGKLGFDSVMFADEVFKNFAKGERPTNEELVTAFGTDNQQEVIVRILNDGELQLTAAERKEKVDKRHREIVTYINKYYVDPKTKLPHPVTRIENALDSMKYRVDPDTPTERQVLDIMKKLPEYLPVKKQLEIEGQLTIPTKFLGACGGILRAMCTVTSESFDGANCIMGVNIAPGDYTLLMSELQNLTKGEFQLEVEGGTATQSSDGDEVEKAKKKPKGGRGGGGGGGKRGGRGGSDASSTSTSTSTSTSSSSSSSGRGRGKRT